MVNKIGLRPHILRAATNEAGGKGEGGAKDALNEKKKSF
jgi:hypothetical protein